MSSPLVSKKSTRPITPERSSKNSLLKEVLLKQANKSGTPPLSRGRPRTPGRKRRVIATNRGIRPGERETRKMRS